ncbi:guanine nucleotide exchange factor MSS4 [Schistocerca americana]|uniref:guanine nucleotide exchange factor MSS4 n=1 Tax=Schistocerca americana TaxID=7009 RepID=UPI001F4FBECB|nr:guanine nucleotide exchange factor MSS4 [Schistocerca americana]XP_049764203.1 guanine nucleotide exchange factor MSS4 [Schistocerca cancellata]XP_049833667.1 guanine nucleotide exchange factor MSS4 [Schistocerca gregaria]XP_049939437.1 guanine nucleotide exchange factor MSS4 [Schistocerca serialis cubense]
MASGNITTHPKIATTFPLQEEIENGRNRHVVRCQRCPSKILNPGMGVYKQVEFPLPHMKQKSEVPSNPEEEVIKDYWVVEDMYSFENVGFSNTVSGVKYLACADCEVGPIGWYDIAARTSYVALSRVLHGNISGNI